MKICWDNLEKLRLSKRGNFTDKEGHNLNYYESCDSCGDPYLGRESDALYCCRECSLKSLAHINKVKTANRYRIITKETREKISKIHKGKYISQATRDKISKNNTKPMLGKHHSYNTKKILSVRKLKDRNPNWKGGISCEPYCKQWDDKKYKNWLKYDRDNGICQNIQCNHKTMKLCLHHINYNKKDCRPTNLITICVSCNTKANRDREWHEAYYTEIIRRKCSDAAA